MRFNEGAGLDVSEIRDIRGGGGGIGGRVAVGGGGVSVVGLLLYFLMAQFGGVNLNSGLGFGLGEVGAGQQLGSSELAQECRTGADANRNHDCAIVAIVNSVQDYWTDQFARSGQTYQKSTTTFFNGGVDTGGCGSASSEVGPFYCPADSGVYIDLSFFDTLRSQFGAQGGLFAEAYVLAHEYGHHVQNLLGTSSRVRGGTGPESDGVRLELQADCYAGVWANHASTTPTENGEPLISEITQDDVDQALDAASRIGDDFIQRELGGGQVDESKFSHGTSRQRATWFTTGLRTGDPARCNTFSARDLG